jgi:hypothetical protein
MVLYYMFREGFSRNIQGDFGLMIFVRSDFQSYRSFGSFVVDGALSGMQVYRPFDFHLADS